MKRRQTKQTIKTARNRGVCFRYLSWTWLKTLPQKGEKPTANSVGRV